VHNIVSNLNLSVLLPLLAAVTVVRFLAMGHYALSRKIYPGFRSFVYAEFFSLLGIGAVALRGRMGETFTLVLLSSLSTLLHPLLVYHGLGAYCRAPHLRAATIQNAVLVAIACLLQLVDLLYSPDITRRVLVYSLASLLLTLRIGLELPFIRRRALSGAGLVGASYLVVAGIHAARAWSVVQWPGYDYGAMLYADQIIAVFIFYRIMQSILELYAVFSMNSVMLEDELRVATAQIERMAQTDVLTGVLNRRGLELLGGEALRRSRQQHRPCAVIMLDLDHFKRVNDTLGHAAGDDLLRAVAALCACSLRADDVFARYGGEEFVVVAPFTDAREAGRLAERMRQAIEHSRFSATREAPVTASFGVASGPCGLWPLLHAADAALYEAKQSGRNRVALAKEPCSGPDVPKDAVPDAPPEVCPPPEG
jgi:diguanylate cyclase (GGDEF)-like protein